MLETLEALADRLPQVVDKSGANTAAIESVKADT